MLILGSLVLIIGEALGKFKKNFLIHLLLSLALIIDILILLSILWYIDDNSLNVFMGNMDIIPYNQLILIFCGLFIIISSGKSMFNLKDSLPLACNISEYILILNLGIIAVSFMLAINDLLFAFLSLELLSYTLYLISGSFFISRKSTYIGLMYFLLGSLASAIILFGIVLIYLDCGSLNLNVVNKEHLGFIFVVFGFLFKLGTSPNHSWAVHTYDLVPTITTTWVSIIPKIGYLFFILKWASLNDLLLLISMLSLFTGSIYGLIQNRLKRLIAYSSISNLGFLLLSVTIENLLGLESFYFYLIQYLFTSINFFLILLSIGYLLFNSLNINKCDLSSPIQILEQIKGLGQRREFIYLSLSLTICLLSFGGIPPFVGFFAKLYVLIASLDYGLLTLTFVAIITSIISMSYYLRIISTLYFTKVEFKQNIGTLSTNYSFMISILTSIIILNICSPNIFINLNQVISFYSI